MAIDEFWANIRAAVELVDSPETTRWLVPRSVGGFDPSEFDFLDEKRYAALTSSVERFRAVIRSVSWVRPAIGPRLEEGRAVFAEIVRILQPQKFRDADSFRLQVLWERELREVLPDWVTGLSGETDTDHLGEPVVRVCVHMTNEALKRGWFLERDRTVDDTIRNVYRDSGGKLRLSLRYQSPGELAQAQESARRRADPHGKRSTASGG